MRNTFANHLLEKARVNPKIMLITGDLGYGVLQQFQKELPKQFLNAGVAEQSMLGLAAGMASRGRKVFVYSIANFPTIRALEQIRNDVSNMDNNVCVVSVGAGLSYGTLGYTHHAVEDIAILRSLPNVEIYSPCDSQDVKNCLDSILEHNKPSYLRLGKGGEPNLIEGNFDGVDSPKTLAQGSDGTIVFTGSIGGRVLLASQILAKKGFNVSVVSISKINRLTISKFLKEKSSLPILSVEEHYLPGGFGSLILEVASDLQLNLKLMRIGLDSKFRNKVGSHSYLLDEAGLKVDNLVEGFIRISE